MAPAPSFIERCPSCSAPLEIRELRCPNCDLQLRGRFRAPSASPLARLSAEQQAFLRLFVTSRGNLSDVERTLGVSYPTVRAKLDDLIEALAEPAPAPPPRPAAPAGAASSPGAPRAPAGPPPRTRHEVLTQIAGGRLSASEGMVLLRRIAADAARAARKQTSDDE